MGGGGGGGFFTGRGQANALTRATAILATLFFMTSLALTILLDADAAVDNSVSRRPRPRRLSASGTRPLQAKGSVLDQSKQIGDRATAPVRAGQARRRRRPAPSALADRKLAQLAPAVRAVGRLRRKESAVASLSDARRIGCRACRRSNARRPVMPWRGIFSLPAAWCPRSARGWPRRRSARCCRRAAIRCGCASSTPISTSIPAPCRPTSTAKCFVTDDGAETDLDLGHYERFTGRSRQSQDNVTTGHIYQDIIAARAARRLSRRHGAGHSRMSPTPSRNSSSTAIDGYDFVLVEIGGTVGDIEAMPFLEAIRQLGNDLRAAPLRLYPSDAAALYSRRPAS